MNILEDARRVETAIKEGRIASGCDYDQIQVLESIYRVLSFGTKFSRDYENCLKGICYISDRNPKDPLICQLLEECSTMARVFLYDKMNRSQNPEYNSVVNSSLSEVLSKSFFTTTDGFTFTKEQQELFLFFKEHRRIVVSAPTSFGKSRMVYEIILANRNTYKNIAIILPTIALISENYIRFKESQLNKEYNIINSLRQVKGDRNIFILTPERMVLLIDEFPETKFDFIVMDEIYKLENDSRSHVFNFCLYQLLKRTKDFYLIGPYFNKMSERFLEITGASFKKFTSEIVQKKTIDVYAKSVGEVYYVDDKAVNKSSTELTDLKRILENCHSQSLVYAPRKQRAETIAKKIASYDCEERSSPLIEYISETIWIGYTKLYRKDKVVVFS